MWTKTKTTLNSGTFSRSDQRAVVEGAGDASAVLIERLTQTTLHRSNFSSTKDHATSFLSPAISFVFSLSALGPGVHEVPSPISGSH